MQGHHKGLMLRVLNELGPELPITDIGKGFFLPRLRSYTGTVLHAVPPSEKPIVAFRFIRQKSVSAKVVYACSTVIVKLKQRQSISLRYLR